VTRSTAATQTPCRLGQACPSAPGLAPTHLQSVGECGSNSGGALMPACRGCKVTHHSSPGYSCLSHDGWGLHAAARKPPHKLPQGCLEVGRAVYECSAACTEHEAAVAVLRGAWDWALSDAVLRLQDPRRRPLCPPSTLNASWTRSPTSCATRHTITCGQCTERTGHRVPRSDHASHMPLLCRLDQRAKAGTAQHTSGPAGPTTVVG
jgi:hypothetical protein